MDSQGEMANQHGKKKKWRCKLKVGAAVLCGVLFIGAAAFLPGCLSITLEPSNSVASAQANMVGNTPSNLANGGWVAAQGDWIYYFRSVGQGTAAAVEKMKTDGTAQATVFQNPDQNSYIDGLSLGDDGWFYYTTHPCQPGDVAGTLHRVRLDGSSSMKLADNCYYSYSFVDNGQLYGVFTDGNEIALSSKNLWRMNPDGTGKALVANDATDFNIADGWLYYMCNGGRYYRVGLDGTCLTVLGRRLPSE